MLLLVVARMAMAQTKTEKIRYAVIGDSYSCGEGAKPNESWPSLMTQHLKAQGLDIELVSNPSVTGWTAKDAIDKELPKFVNSNPNFATLLIGVNDWVQNVDELSFRNRLSYLLDSMLAVLPNKKRLLVVTIPDFGVTPSGPKYSRGRNIHEGISTFNKIVTDEAHKRGLQVVDIFPLSKKMGQDKSLVAKDGLHPSAKAYADWERLIFPAALELLKEN
ncbi:MAG TPA: SGNH/GDSL hydrolase family protein [Chthoniobacterales bacterium]|nr:SGNH/GDSL hydrolase family protein [Chthoniobacterales bacterium]